MLDEGRSEPEHLTLCWSCAPATYDNPDAVLLVAAVQREYVERYGGEDASPVDPAEFAPPLGYFTIGYVHGETGRVRWVAGPGRRAR